MQKKLLFFFVIITLKLNGQESLLKVGDRFPDLTIANISNAPVKEFSLNKVGNNKFYILNFWGTWCNPCIPEMDTLAKLQKQNKERVQVIAISNDNEKRKTKYLQNKPSDIWLATDTSYTLYRMFNLAYVGQSAIINPDKKIVALVRTDSINQKMIDKILHGDVVKTSADINEPHVETDKDPFGVDSLMKHSFSICGYKMGERGRSIKYFSSNIYNARRLTWFNTSIGWLYRDAYGIKSLKQEVYDSSINKNDVNPNFLKDKDALYCVDILVSPTQKDSLYTILQQRLKSLLPIKARLEKRKLEVYVLKQMPKTNITFRLSKAEKSSFSFSGRGFNGIKILVKNFAEDYLTNEMDLPVVDETALLGFYDIKTNVEQRDINGIFKSINELGLILEKEKRLIPVIIYYK